METDALGWYQLSAQGGHAGPGSSVDYIHQVEEAIALVSKTARPQAWLTTHMDGLSCAAFPDIEVGVTGVRPPTPPRMPSKQPPQLSSEMDIFMREAIAWRVATGLKFQSIASELEISVDLVGTVVEELVQAMLMRQLVQQELTINPRKQSMAIAAYVLWARAAKQEKFQFFAKHLSTSTQQEERKASLQLWQDWSLCQVDKFVALENPRPATRIAALLLKVGASRKSLAVSSVNGAVPLAAQIKQLGLAAKPCAERSNRAEHRLFLSPKGVDASKATGATISMVGFHWWMLLLGSFLIAVEEI
jgi:hypothetical protein